MLMMPYTIRIYNLLYKLISEAEKFFFLSSPKLVTSDLLFLEQFKSHASQFSHNILGPAHFPFIFLFLFFGLGFYYYYLNHLIIS